VKTACQCLVRNEETQARNQPGEKVERNIIQAEHSFNRKLMKVRVQRKQVVFTTVAAFLRFATPDHAEGIRTAMLL
jgi:hypothetical protein